MAKNSNPGMFIVFIAITGIIMGIILVTAPETTTAPTETKSQEISATNEQLYRNDAPYSGNKDGEIKIVVFSDYLCPYCKKLSLQLDDLVKKHSDLIVYNRSFVVDPQSEILSKAVEAASIQGKGGEANTLVFNEYTEIASEDDILSLADKLKINKDQFKKDLESETVSKNVLNDSETAQQLGLQGTPSIFLNGRYIDNPSDIESMIDELK